MKIAIATFEYEGITKNGGVGTAYRRLAELLQKNGHSVTIILLPFLRLSAANLEKKFARSIKAARKSGVDIIIPDYLNLEKNFFRDSSINARAQAVFEHLRNKQYDIVHSPDNGALLYRSLGAKLAGSVFQNTHFLIGAHGSALWTSIANQKITTNDMVLAAYDMACVQNADSVVSPSKYMQVFLHDSHWKDSKQIQVIPNVNELSKYKKMPPAYPVAQKKNKLIFFGRLETRKGFSQFVEAISLQAQKSKIETGLQVYFLGSIHYSISKKEITKKIRAMLQKNSPRISIKFISSYNSEEAINFLRKNRDGLICIPSLLENSPYTVVECLENAFNFICTNSGGQAELIDQRDHRYTLCESNPMAIQNLIASRLSQMHFAARPSELAKSANKKWLMLHSKKRIEKELDKTASSKISIFLGLFSSESSRDLISSYSSIVGQNYSNIELWIPETFKVNFMGKTSITIKTFRSNNVVKVATKATGKYILFMDGIQFQSSTSLGDLSRAIENLAKRDKNSLCYTADISEIRNRKSQIVSLLPATEAGLLAGEACAASHSVWDRKLFLKWARQFDFLPTTEATLRPFCSSVFQMGGNFKSIPYLAFRDPLDMQQRKKMLTNYLYERSISLKNRPWHK